MTSASWDTCLVTFLCAPCAVPVSAPRGWRFTRCQPGRGRALRTLPDRRDYRQPPERRAAQPAPRPPNGRDPLRRPRPHVIRFPPRRRCGPGASPRWGAFLHLPFLFLRTDVCGGGRSCVCVRMRALGSGQGAAGWVADPPGSGREGGTGGRGRGGRGRDGSRGARGRGERVRVEGVSCPPCGGVGARRVRGRAAPLPVYSGGRDRPRPPGAPRRAGPRRPALLPVRRVWGQRPGTRRRDVEATEGTGDGRLLRFAGGTNPRARWSMWSGQPRTHALTRGD